MVYISWGFSGFLGVTKLEQQINESQEESEIQPNRESPEIQPYKESMEIVLELFKDEYNAEHERANTYEARTGMLITLAGAVLVFEAQNFIIPKKGSIAGASLLVSSELISLILLITSMIVLIKVISTRTFYRVNTDPFREGNESYYEHPTKVMGSLIDQYNNSIKSTSVGIESRTRWFTVGLWLLVAGLIFVTLSRIISLFLMG
jgi:hypothetical protein